MNNTQDIGKLAQQTFSNFEADVPAEAWTNIQNALLLSPAVPANTSVNAKIAGGIFSKINAVVVWSSSIVVVSLVTVWPYFSSPDEPIKANILQDEVVATSPVQDQSSEQQINNQQSTPNNSIPLELRKEDLAIAAADNKNANHQTFSTNNEVETAAQEEANKDFEPEAINSHNTEPVNTATTSIENKTENASEPDETSNEESENSHVTATENSEIPVDVASLGLIPNIITPNNDNENDIFIIEGNGLKSLKVSIMDISGKIVHEWSGLHGFWDGKLENGSDAKPGIYFYNIFAISEKNKPLTQKKSFRLIR